MLKKLNIQVKTIYKMKVIVQALNGLYMKEGKIYRHSALTLLPDINYDKLGTRWIE